MSEIHSENITVPEVPTTIFAEDLNYAVADTPADNVTSAATGVEESYTSKRQRVECEDDKIGMHLTILGQALTSQNIAVPSKFKASTKDLYSDFVVREIPSDADGVPLRLHSLGEGGEATKKTYEEKQQAKAEKKERKEKEAAEANELITNPDVYMKLQEEVIAAFTSIIGEDRAKNMAEAVTVGNAENFIIGAIVEKENRGLFHKEVKRLLGMRYVSSTDNGQVVINRANAQMRMAQDRRSAAGQTNVAAAASSGGTVGTEAVPVVERRANTRTYRYLHFTVYKENTDSASALRFIANQCGLSSRQLMFSGTKDKRAVTLQRLACRGLDFNKLERINRTSVSRNGIVRVGDYLEKETGLSLGDLAGNHFTIALRIVDEASAKALRGGTYPLDLIQQTLSRNGFINYFGPQRFGTTSILTSDMGRLLLKGEYREAVTAILASRCEISPEAHPMHHAFTTLPAPECYQKALYLAPMYCFSERDLLKFLLNNPGNYKGAFTAMQRTSVMMYFHAVQSWFWNEWVSRRLSLGPMAPMVGDMVIVGGTLAGDDSNEASPAVGDGEASPTSTTEDNGNNNNNYSKPDTQKLPTIHHITAEDIAQNKYTIFDVVMTVPGCDPNLQYPENCGIMTKDKLSKEVLAQGLQTLFDPTSEMARQYHFFGTYRKMVLALNDFKLAVKTYNHPSEVLIPTDLQILKELQTGVETFNKMAVAPTTAAHQGVAVIAEFSLPAGAYATCVLREFCETVRGNM